MATLQAHGERVLSARFSPDGQRIVTASDDKTARVWTILPPSAGAPPSWFPDFLRYMAQKWLNSNGELEPIPPTDWLALRDRLRQVVRETAAQDTPYLRILRHFVHGASAKSATTPPLVVEPLVEPTSPLPSASVQPKSIVEQTSMPQITKGSKLDFASITKDQPYENNLGMRFVPVPGTNVLFSIWETR